MNKLRKSNIYSIRNCLHCQGEFMGTKSSKWCSSCRGKMEASFAASGSDAESVKWREILPEEAKECFFCGKSGVLRAHHIDKDRGNNSEENLMLLCHVCHNKIHKTVYRPILKRSFSILLDNRYTYEEIANYFGTSKQNVYGILKDGREQISTGTLQK